MKLIKVALLSNVIDATIKSDAITTIVIKKAHIVDRREEIKEIIMTIINNIRISNTYGTLVMKFDIKMVFKAFAWISL